MTQIKRFVDSLESINSESMSLLFKTRGKNMEKTEVSVLFVQKQKEKISHTSFDEFKIKVQQSNCLRGWLAFYIHSYSSHVSRMVITISQKNTYKKKGRNKKTQPRQKCHISSNKKIICGAFGAPCIYIGFYSQFSVSSSSHFVVSSSKLSLSPINVIF